MAERVQATPKQLKAVASAVRLRILRLCGENALTNKEIADALDKDPATVLHHVRLLVDAGLLESTGVRQGARGAYEKPYRSTGLSWRLTVGQIVRDEDHENEAAMLVAFRDDLARAGTESIEDMSRFQITVSPEQLDDFKTRMQALLDEYVDPDQIQNTTGATRYSGLFVIHRDE